jgi:hypothetical protein
VSLTDRPQYHAVSYVWGNSTIVDTLACDGAHFGITANLKTTLLRFRLSKSVRTVWVDAICINQEDEREKAQQVRLMGLIYWEATQVIVWLGNDKNKKTDLTNARTIELMQYYGNLYWSTTGDVPYIGSDADIEKHDKFWSSVARFFARPWFTRVWTVQEVGLAKEAIFYFGESNITRHILSQFVAFLERKADAIIRVYGIKLQHYKLIDYYQQCTRYNYRLEYGSDPSMADDFLQLLHRAQGLKCTNPKDAIYAFLGHPSAFKTKLLDSDPYMWYPRNFEERIAVIQPDYSKGFEVKELFLQIAYSALDTWELGPNLFAHVRHNEATIKEDYPSWVPSWDLVSERAAYSLYHGFYYHACGDMTDTQLEVERSDMFKPTIRVKALAVGTVLFTYTLPATASFDILSSSDKVITNKMPQSTVNPVEDLRAIFMAHRRRTLTERSRNDEVAFALTLTAGIISTVEEDSRVPAFNQHHHHERPLEVDPELNFADYNCYRLSKSAGWDPDLQHEVRSQLATYPGNADRFCVKVAIAAASRTFFCTHNGYIGLGPRITKLGDQCWIPVGSNMPCILRPVAPGRYKVPGQAYVNGVMKGELFKDSTSKSFREIVLC